MTVRTTFEPVRLTEGRWAVLRVLSSDRPDGPAPEKRIAFGPPRFNDLDEAAARRLARRLAEIEARRG